MNILELLLSGKVLASDGAMGTELQKRGMKPGTCPEELNIINPEIVRVIHKDYYNAGSDFVETNSFGGNRIRLKLHNMGDKAYEFSKKAAELAKSVCPEGKFVAGSIGPTGEILAPFGSLNLEDAYNSFAEQAQALAEGGADLLIIETMMSAEEAEAAVKAAKEKTNLPVAATMTFEAGGTGMKTMWGVDVQTAVKILSDAGADIIGSNCGRGFDEMYEVVKEMKQLTSKPIIAQANAGLPELVDGKNIYKETPEIIAPKVQRILELGVNIIGGCCGTNPEHIRLIRKLVDNL